MTRKYYKCVCTHCGRTFMAQSPDAEYCLRKECRMAKKGPALITRKCHDCGKKTTNYRCNACWRAYREKHGIKLNPSDDGLAI